MLLVKYRCPKNGGLTTYYRIQDVLNIHEKNMEKFSDKKNKLLLFLLLTVIQCKQRCTRTSLPCNVTVVDLI
jgi:hypothetical protein